MRKAILLIVVLGQAATATAALPTASDAISRQLWAGVVADKGFGHFGWNSGPQTSSSVTCSDLGQDAGETAETTECVARRDLPFVGPYQTVEARYKFVFGRLTEIEADLASDSRVAAPADVPTSIDLTAEGISVQFRVDKRDKSLAQLKLRNEDPYGLKRYAAQASAGLDLESDGSLDRFQSSLGVICPNCAAVMDDFVQAVSQKMAIGTPFAVQLFTHSPTVQGLYSIADRLGRGSARYREALEQVRAKFSPAPK